MAIAPTLFTPGIASSDDRTSNANVPIPHARGGYVEKIAVRTVPVRPFRQVSGVLALKPPEAWPGQAYGSRRLAAPRCRRPPEHRAGESEIPVRRPVVTCGA